MRRLAASALLLASAPFAVGGTPTPAGTLIQASAEVSCRVGTVPVFLRSNAPLLTVDQLIDVAVVPAMAAVPVRAAETGRSLAFRVVNTGNAPETLHLQLATAVAGNAFDARPAAPPLYLDADGSGTLSGGDPAYAPGDNDPVLAPGASAVVLAVVDVPAGVADATRARVELGARVAQGTGAPGSVVGQAGAGGVEAIAGASGGVGRATSELVVSGVDVALVKSATIVAADGSAHAASGSRIDYDIAVHVTGSGLVHGLVVADPIPSSTRYVPASVAVDGVAQSDASVFQSTPGQVQVALGDVPAGAVHHVRFSVLIN